MKHGTCIGLGGAGIVIESYAGGGDVEVAEIGAAEGAGRYFFNRKVDLSEAFAGLGLVADDAPALPQGDPQVAFRVNGHAIRKAFALWNGDGYPAVVDVAAAGIKVKCDDLAGGAVDVVERPTFTRQVPGQTI